MGRKIQYSEYRRRVFNEAVLEVLARIHGEVLGLDEASLVSNDAAVDQDTAAKEVKTSKILNDDNVSSETRRMANEMARHYFEDELGTKDATVSKTKQRLSEACHFLAEAADVCEQIADRKTKDAKELGIEIEDDQKTELSPEDHAVIDQLFQTKDPRPQVDAIRDATVNALLAEEKKSKEIQDATDLAKAKVASGEDPRAFDETVRRINAIGPTSLMDAVMNSVTVAAVKDVSAQGKLGTISETIAANKELIQERSCMIYSLYEMTSVLGITRMTPAKVKALAESIYYNK